MASGGNKGEGAYSLPDWVAKFLPECPVCLDPIKDPPVYLCEEGHAMCQTCRDPLKAQDQPCPLCRKKLVDTRNLAVENLLGQLPKIKCKNEGCTFERSDSQLVKRHEDEECRERLGKCEICQEPIALSKLVGHLGTKHGKKPLGYPNLGDTKEIRNSLAWNGHFPLKVNNDLEFMFNWKSYDTKATMFWVSFCGSPAEAKDFEYTIKIESAADKNGRTRYALSGTGECLSCEVSHEEAKMKATEVMIFSKDILAKAAEGNDKNKLEWRLQIQKK